MIVGKINSKKTLTGKINNATKYITPTLENIEITPSKEEQVFNHPNSDGYDEVRVKGVTSEVDENIIAENIKSDVEILGVKGTFVGAKYKPRFISFYYYTGDSLDYEVANLDTSLITNMEYMFYGLKSRNLTTLDLSNFDTNNVTTMKNMFYSSSRLETINLRGFNTSNVTDMSSMFGGCNKLKNLDVSTFDTSNVTNMGSMFNVCYNLVSLDLSSFDTSNVTNMRYMFGTCEALQHLDIRNFTFDNVTDKAYMFQYVPSSCEIIVKSETEKTWITKNFGTFNIKTVAEYEGE